MDRTCIITGVRGQIGSFLAEQLIAEGYKVHGLIRRASHGLDLGCAKHLESNPMLEVVEGDLLDLAGLSHLCQLVKPDLFFNMAAQSVHPDSLVHIKLDGRYTKTIPIKDLWDNPQRQGKLGIQTEICNTEGGKVEVEVMNMPDNVQLKVLAYRGGMGQWFPIKQISRHKYRGNLCKLRQKWGEVLVTPNHSVYNIQGQLVSPTSNPELLPMRKINYYNTSPKEEVDLPISGKNICGKLSFKEGNLQEFMEFCGAFISEGWTTYNKSNGSYIVAVCQQDKSWLEWLQGRMKSFYSGSSCIVAHKKEGYDDVYRLEVSSKEMYLLMRKLCGTSSENKKIPDFLFELDPKLWDFLINHLIEGDGSIFTCKHYCNLRYKTTSRVLIAQLALIWSYLGIDYTYTHTVTDGYLDSYELRQSRYYQTNQGQRDYEEVPYNGYVYDISVDEVHNFVVGLGNVVVHNSHVGTSFEQPIYTAQATGLGVLNCLEAIRISGIHTRFLQASTSELFGGVSDKQSNEETPFYPRSPYGCAKLFGHWITINYRESYKLYACCAICHNNESERRGPNFVTRKITKAAARIKLGKQSKLYLGNLEAKRDWGYSGDTARGMILMLTKSFKPTDYVLATGKTHSVKDFCRAAFSHLDLNWSDYVSVDPRYYRPAEVNVLVGNYTKIKEELGWEPWITFEELVRRMVEHDLKEEKKDVPGYQVPDKIDKLSTD